MKVVEFKKFKPQEHQVWKVLFDRLDHARRDLIVPQFLSGLDILRMTANEIPDLNEVNRRLQNLTGWKGVAVEGLQEGKSFYQMLADRQFPIGNFIRSETDLSYTPEPDIFHDLYGHIPFLTDPEYADFCQNYGQKALEYLERPSLLRQFERFFWFTIEFGLLETAMGRRIFGAGIASSFGECEYALSKRPLVLDFDIESIRQTEFRIDVFQERLFVMKDAKQLYQSLDAFPSHLV